MNTDHVQYRTCRETDLPICLQIETSSYPPDEAAAESSLEYRQRNATAYFMCAVATGTTGSNNTNALSSSLSENHECDAVTLVIGFICSTRCHSFTHDSMTIHVPDGKLLAIHSVVVTESFRRRGIATQMLRQYIQTVTQELPTTRPTKIVLLAKSHLLSFYVNCGFRVMRPSAISHGTDQWYDLEMSLDGTDSVTDSIIPGRNYYVVDAFADPKHKGTGNPAAVVPVECEPTDVNWMQVVAQEMNLSETAFVWKIPQQQHRNIEEASSLLEESNHYGIRYFTPTIEVDLCGHATLASASILCNIHKCKDVVFHANHSVTLLASQKQVIHTNCAQISMTFPSQICLEILDSDSDRVVVETMLQNAFPMITSDDILYIGNVPGLSDLLIEVKYDAFLHDNCKVLNIRALLEWEGCKCGIILCCATGTTEANKESDGNILEIDFYSRFFAPKAGIDEDPVTGSAHTALAPYFGKKLQKTQLIGQQKSIRGGIVYCDISDDGRSVTLTGTAVTTATGTLWM